MTSRTLRTAALLVGIALFHGTSAAGAQSHVDDSPLHGDAHLDRFAHCFTTIADLDGDGTDDIAIGAPGDDTGGAEAGAVHVHSGADLDERILSAYGSADESFGSALCAAGDVDGDGFEDLAVGVPCHDGLGGTDQGRIDVLSGATFAVLTSFTVDEPNIEFGSALANVGDRDGDGIDDLLVGAPYADALASDGGAAFLLAVTPTGVSLLQRIDGSGSTELLGTSVSGLGDVDGDGVGEIVTGNPGWSNGAPAYGRVQVYSGDFGLGCPMLLSWNGSQPFDFFGHAIDEIQDPDGQGHPSLVISFHGRTNSSGQDSAGGCAIYDALTAAKTREHEGDHWWMCLGMSLAAVDDQDGDGFEDVLIGAPLDAWGGQIDQGSVELLSTSPSSGISMTRLYRIAGDSGLSRLGNAVGSLPDLDGDGCRELGWGAETETPSDSTEQLGALPRPAYSQAATPPRQRQLHGLREFPAPRNFVRGPHHPARRRTRNHGTSVLEDRLQPVLALFGPACPTPTDSFS